MNKKGAWSLESLGIILIGVILALVGLGVLFGLWGALFHESMTVPQKDMERVISNLYSLAPGESIEVFTRGQNYRLVLYPRGHPLIEKECVDEACICVYEEGGFKLTKCTVLKDIDCDKAREKPEQYSCVDTSETVIISNRGLSATETITVCKSKKAEGARLSIKC